MKATTPIEIMFMHKPSRSITFCKVVFAKLNWKLRKLQNEGMYIIGVYVTEQVEESEEQLSLPLTEEESDVRAVGEAVEAVNC